MNVGALGGVLIINNEANKQKGGLRPPAFCVLFYLHLTASGL